MTEFLINITGFVPNITGSVLSSTGFVLTITEFVLNISVLNDDDDESNGLAEITFFIVVYSWRSTLKKIKRTYKEV